VHDAPRPIYCWTIYHRDETHPLPDGSTARYEQLPGMALISVAPFACDLRDHDIRAHNKSEFNIERESERERVRMCACIDDLSAHGLARFARSIVASFAANQMRI